MNQEERNDLVDTARGVVAGKADPRPEILGIMKAVKETPPPGLGGVVSQLVICKGKPSDVIDLVESAAYKLGLDEPKPVPHDYTEREARLESILGEIASSLRIVSNRLDDMVLDTEIPRVVRETLKAIDNILQK